MVAAGVEWRSRRLTLGDDAVQLHEAGDDASSRLLVNLHRNETGSVEAASGLLASGIEGVRVARFDAAPDRLLRVRLAGKQLAFDPNRIFSRVGIGGTLRKENTIEDEGLFDRAVTAVEAFATVYRSALRLDSATFVLALHNTGDDYCIHSYAEGGEESAWTEALHQGVGQHRHDFFLTTGRRHFDALAARGYNVVLERLDDALDDGSLSVYCARRGIRYVNCEARYDAAAYQQEMLRAALDCCGA